MPIVTLEQFAIVNDLAAATTKKLAKQQLLADFFRTVEPDEDLRRTVRFAGGRAFAGSDERVLGVSGAIVTSAVFPLLNTSEQIYRERVVSSGEIGEALATLWNRDDASLEIDPRRRTTLADLAQSFDELAATGVQETKRQIVRSIFERCRTPREAAYAAKIIFGDLRTGVQDGVLQAAIAQAFDQPLKAIQRAQLLEGDLDAVAVLARHGQLDRAVLQLFHPVQFMLATPQETSADAVAMMAGRTFNAEEKLDGIRAQIHKQGNRVAIYTRTMDRTDESFPDVVRAIESLPGDVLLDGEIVPYRDGRVRPFASIQKRLGRKVLTTQMLRDHPTVFIAFDLLYADGDLLIDRPLRERRARLEALPLIRSHAIEVATAEQIDAAFALARENGNEGLVLKDPESPYSPGRRGQSWLKIKTHLPTLDCVVTTAEFGHGKRRNSLSDYTFAVWDRDASQDGAALVNVGKAFSGVTDEEIAKLTDLFQQIAVARRGRVFQVKPEVVLEIAFDQIQRSTRHASGYALRFPRIKRIRWDKKPADADRLDRVAELYASVHNFGRSDTPDPTPEPTLFDGL
ncbi:ATP-dependent DNA ligase [soil metagenome]